MATGMAIALIVRRIEFAVPLALASHFILDSVPHSTVSVAHKTVFRVYLIIESIAMAALLVGAIIFFPQLWPLIVSCALAAFLPDVLWPFFYNGMLRNKPFFRKFFLFHQKIQWSETHRGWLVEGLYLIVLTMYIFEQYALQKITII